MGENKPTNKAVDKVDLAVTLSNESRGARSSCTVASAGTTRVLAQLNRHGSISGTLLQGVTIVGDGVASSSCSLLSAVGLAGLGVVGDGCVVG